MNNTWTMAAAALLALGICADTSYAQAPGGAGTGGGPGGRMIQQFDADGRRQNQ
ncbi:MAG: hypothetical protein HC826_01135 [Rhodospirillales bacterium]|nr:hypothetical protein [Rhodospirillales bacterium]